MATTQTAPKKKGLINFDFLQKLGKVLMTVIAVMPAAGLMISLGKLVQMSGGDIAAAIGLCKRKETAIRQHPINFPTLRITVSSLNESKEHGKRNNSHHQQQTKNADCS